MQNMKYFINIEKQPKELKTGIQQVMDEYPLSIRKGVNAKEKNRCSMRQCSIRG